jgi:stage IV sporulation protein FB
MLSFRLFGFPVNVHWMFWLLCLFLGMPFLEQDGPSGLGMFVLMTAVVFGSIIWHELGHAWARKKSGAPYSEISLHGMGGLCAGPGRFTRWESVFIAAAGPGASLLLGAVTYLLVYLPGAKDPWLGFFIGQMLWVNVGWAIMNLFPILPLDGGHIMQGLLVGKHSHLVPKIGFVLAVTVAIVGLIVLKSIFMAVIFGLFAHTNWQMMQGQRSVFR